MLGGCLGFLPSTASSNNVYPLEIDEGRSRSKKRLKLNKGSVYYGETPELKQVMSKLGSSFPTKGETWHIFKDNV